MRVWSGRRYRRKGNESKEATRGQVGQFLGQETTYGGALGMIVLEGTRRTLPLRGSEEVKGKEDFISSVIC